MESLLKPLVLQTTLPSSIENLINLGIVTDLFYALNSVFEVPLARPGKESKPAPTPKPETKSAETPNLNEQLKLFLHPELQVHPVTKVHLGNKVQQVTKVLWVHQDNKVHLVRKVLGSKRSTTKVQLETRVLL